MFCNSVLAGGTSMGDKSNSGISRREFARRAAFVSAAASLASAISSPQIPLLHADCPATREHAKLSPESQAEVESRIHSIFAHTGAGLLTLRRPIFGDWPPKHSRRSNVCARLQPITEMGRVFT